MLGNNLKKKTFFQTLSSFTRNRNSDMKSKTTKKGIAFNALKQLSKLIIHLIAMLWFRPVKAHLSSLQSIWKSLKNATISFFMLFLNETFSLLKCKKKIISILNRQIILFGSTQPMQRTWTIRNGGVHMPSVRYSIWILIRIKCVSSPKWFNWLQHFCILWRRCVKWSFLAIICLSRIWWVIEIEWIWEMGN